MTYDFEAMSHLAADRWRDADIEPNVTNLTRSLIETSRQHTDGKIMLRAVETIALLQMRLETQGQALAEAMSLIKELRERGYGAAHAGADTGRAVEAGEEAPSLDAPDLDDETRSDADLPELRS